MWKDPIVEETRSVGMNLSKKAGNNLHQLCEMLRKAEKNMPLNSFTENRSRS